MLIFETYRYGEEKFRIGSAYAGYCCWDHCNSSHHKIKMYPHFMKSRVLLRDQRFMQRNRSYGGSSHEKKKIIKKYNKLVETTQDFRGRDNPDP